MDAKAIHERAKVLEKAYTADEVPVILRTLEELRKGVKPTDDLLRKTKIGILVNRTKAHKDPAVQRLAADTVRKWREQVHLQSKARGGTASPTPNGSASKRAAAAAGAGSGTASPVPAAAPDVDPAKRTWKTDRVDLNRTEKPTRNNSIGLIYDGLAFMSTLPAPRILSVAAAVEAACHSAHGPESREGYKSRLRSLYQNLKNKSSGPLRAAVLAGGIAPAKFVVMTHEELKTAELKAEERALEAENMRAAQAPVEEKAVSSSLTCGKCGQKKVSYSQAQTRSADEPMTTFCECMACGRRWKFS